jgi:tetratricopeptide (TPR) repeat protein
LYCEQERYGLAIHFLEAAAKTLKEADVYTNLGLSYKKVHQVQKAREWFEKSIQENPTAESLCNYSAMFIECGEDQKCMDLCEQSIAKKPDLNMAHWNLSIGLLGNGKWERAWDEYEWGLKEPSLRENRDLAGVPYWNGEEGTVLVYGEQGMGDEIMFASMLPDLLKTNKVVFECHTRLENLFRKSFPQIKVYGTREEREKPAWVSGEKIDYRISIGSLGKFYRRTQDSFPGAPYLKADPLPKGNKFRIGISWTGGGIKPGRVAKRTVPLVYWQSILNTLDVEFVSLQYTDCAKDLELVNGMGHDIKIMDEYAKAHDYYETARLVASCDLVISVCTSVVHLAGALGVPCWVMTPKWPAWRYQNTGRMPFYRSVRLYRQPSEDARAWIGVVERIAQDLPQYIKSEQRILRLA